jgi:hypothetical protein
METADASVVAPSDQVDDEELLYRAVRKRHFIRHSETDVTVSENAFTDPKMQPSVDRAQMRDFEPHRTRFNESDGIASLVTRDVRAIDDVFQNTASGQPTGDPYVFDVIWRPIKDDPDPKVRDNPAHSQVETERAMNDGTFKRLRRRLALLGSGRIELHPLEQVVYFSSTRKVYHRRTCRHLKHGTSGVPFRQVPAEATACKQCQPEGWATEEPAPR